MKTNRLATTDDLGKEVEMLRLDQRAYRDDPELAATVTQLNESLWLQIREKPLTAKHVLIVLCVIVAIVIAGITSVTLLAPPFDRFMFPMVMLLGVGGQMLYFRREQRKRHRQVADSILRIGRCPCCGYDVRAIPSRQQDDVRICTECGAGWSARRIGTGTVSPALLPRTAETPGDTAPLFSNYFRLLTRPAAIIDGRNRTVPCSSITLSGLEKSIDAERAAQVRDAIRRETWNARMFGVVLMSGVAALLLLPMITALAVSGPGFRFHFGMLIYPMFIVFYVITARRYWLGNTPKAARITGAILRSESICPSCLHDLSLLVRESDDCVMCPRCSAVWKTGYGRAGSVASRNTTSV